MPYGYDEIVESFKKLADSRLLFNAYLFFGEPQVGKFLFAKSLANYVENKKFEEPSNPLLETLIIDFRDLKYGKEESKESIGIDEIRELERFLYQTPINSYYRIAIIRDAEWLTDIAQNALLKILE
jgi:DNA polymerase III gamma/tau subunit